MSEGIKWSRFVYCAAFAALTTFLVMRDASLWLSIPVGVFAVWWTVICTRALWTLLSFQIAVWRLHQAPSPSIDDARKIKRREWLADPKLDVWINLATVVGVLMFPALLWLHLILWLFG